MTYSNSFNPIESICSIIETYFCLERQSHSRQKYQEQINDELVLILKKAIDLSENPKLTLIQLGIIVFPGSIAIKKNKVAQLLRLCKSSLESRMKNAGWNASDIYCISTVQRILKKIVRQDYKNWNLKSIPKGSSFDAFINSHPEVVRGKNKILTEEEFFSSINYSQMSSPIPHDC